MKELSKYRGCLLAGAAGDALGYPVEFMGEGAIFSRYGRQGIGAYALTGGVALISDDTQMTLFTAAGLLAARTQNMSLTDSVWASYQDWFRTQTGRQFREKERPHTWLANVPALWSARAPGNTCMGSMTGRPGSMDEPQNHSRGCGGVMRVAPVGLWMPAQTGVSQQDVDELGARCAALTHGGDLAWLPAAMLAHMVSVLVHGEGFTPESAASDGLEAVKRQFSTAPHIGQFAALMERAMDLARSAPDDLDAIHQLGEGWYGDEALAVAVYCAVKYSDDLEKALITAVNHRGDSDSTGAIAGNILGAYLGLDAIPQKFTERLELKDVILEMADDLFRDDGSETAADSVWKEKYADGTWKGPARR